MTDFTKKTFSVAVGSDEYRENFDRVFRKNVERPDEPFIMDPTWEGVHNRPGSTTQCAYLAREGCSKCGWLETPEAVKAWTKMQYMPNGGVISPGITDPTKQLVQDLVKAVVEENPAHAAVDTDSCSICHLLKRAEDFLSRGA